MAFMFSTFLLCFYKVLSNNNDKTNSQLVFTAQKKPRRRKN